jgi:hypothetical protein
VKVIAIAVLAAGLLTGCSSGNKPETETSSTAAPAKAAAVQTKTGRAAFLQMYVAARGWAGDAMPFEEDSQPSADATGVDGLSAVWNGNLGSASKSQAKTFTWSSESGGVSQSSITDYSANNSSTRPFDLGFVKSDSNDAFKVAQEHGGKKLLEKDKNTQITYRLHWDAGSNAPLWHVIYSGANGSSKLAVVVNATTGQFVKTE